MSKTIAVSGYFDPIHVGHLDYLEMSKKLGDKLIVIVNNNNQCVLKKGKPFMDEHDRVRIVAALNIVDEVFLSIDTDKTVCKSLEAIKPDIFANGGETKQFVNHLRQLNQIFLQMEETELLQKFQNLLFVISIILKWLTV